MNIVANQLNLNKNVDLLRAYWIKINVSGKYVKLIFIIKQYKNANNTGFGSFEKPLMTS